MVPPTQLSMTIKWSLQLNCIWYSRGPSNSTVFDTQGVPLTQLSLLLLRFFPLYLIAPSYIKLFSKVMLLHSAFSAMFRSIHMFLTLPLAGGQEDFLAFHRENTIYLFLFIGKWRKSIFAREELWLHVKNSKDPATFWACQSRAAFLLLSFLVAWSGTCN